MRVSKIGPLLGLVFLFSNGVIQAQEKNDPVLQVATLDNCVQYALKHYPYIQQALLDEEITERQIRSRLADWYPQISFNASYQNNFQLPVTYFEGAAVASGSYNAATFGLSGTQNIFNRDVLLASKTAADVRRQTRQTTVSDKIDVTVNVSKAFYDVLLTEKQIELVEEDIERLDRSLKDSYNQYRSGIVDKTDYKRATISLNNSRAEKKTYEEALKSKMANLKLQMGYPADSLLQIQFDSLQMEKEALLDTGQSVNYNNRIEYQLLQTEKQLQIYNLKYNRWSYLPNVSAVAGYDLYYLSDPISQLFNQKYPYSFAGIELSVPIFQGTKRVQNIRVAELQLKRLDWDIAFLKDNISSQYVQAIAIYKANLNDYYILKENVDLAREVYNTLSLQYRSGVKAYLDVITAETDLRNAQSNYTNALYQVLSSKLDVEKALGTIKY